MRADRVQVAVGPGEHRADRGAEVAGGIKQVEAPRLVSKFADKVSKGNAGSRGGQFGSYTQREWQPAAFPGERRDRRQVSVGPLADEFLQQADRIRHGEQIQIYPGRAFAGDKPGQRVAAGDEHREPGVPGSSGRTWSADPALSRRMSIRLPASRLR